MVVLRIWKRPKLGHPQCDDKRWRAPSTKRVLPETQPLATSPPADPAQSTPREGMFRELLYIHSLLRRDLQTVRRLADEARSGLSPQTILTEIRNLETNSPLWRLRFGCMHYCRFVHGHHTLEDAALFPMVRKHDPSLSKVIDRLEEDHLTVHHITERIAALADEVPTDVSGATREALVDALTD